MLFHRIGQTLSARSSQASDNFSDLNYPEDSKSYDSDQPYELSYASAHKPPSASGTFTVADASEFDTESKIDSQYTESRINMKSTSDFEE